VHQVGFYYVKRKTVFLLENLMEGGTLEG